MTAPTTTAQTGCWDADRSGQVLLWAPQGAGDFADLAWVVAQLLGNGPGVRSLDVHRKADGPELFVYVRADGPEYVEEAAAAHGFRLYTEDGYATASGRVGEVHLDITWLDSDRSTGAAVPS